MTLAIADDDDIESLPELDTSADTPQRTTRELECVLNDTEVRERGQTMATAERDADRLKVRRKNLNAQIRGLLDRVSELATAIESRRETREIACTWTPDYQRRTWTLTRDDTSEALEQRAMTAADLQTRLPIDGGDDAGTGDEAGDVPPDDAPGDSLDDYVDDGFPPPADLLPARSTPADAAVMDRARARNTAPARKSAVKAKAKAGKAPAKRKANGRAR
jgi:hypothetical protein